MEEELYTNNYRKKRIIKEGLNCKNQEYKTDGIKKDGTKDKRLLNPGTKSIFYQKSPEKWEQEINGYIDGCEDVKTEITDKNGCFKGYNVKANIPLIDSLARQIGICPQTLMIWAQDKENIERYEIFSRAILKIKEKQLSKLINNGLDGSYNPTVTNRLLSAFHHITEKTENVNMNVNANISLKDKLSEEQKNNILKTINIQDVNDMK